MTHKGHRALRPIRSILEDIGAVALVIFWFGLMLFYIAMWHGPA